MLRLVGRLETNLSPSAFGRRSVDPNLLEQVAQQAEAQVSAAVRARYRWPLVNATSAILQEIVEKLAVCSLLPIHYQGSAPSNAGADYASIVCKDAQQQLASLRTGPTLLGEVLISDRTAHRNTKAVPRARTEIEEIDFCSPNRVGASPSRRRIPFP
ncbi:MAG: DUF1320 family protein [Synechococcales cyanobacterium RU_4_20]|nr:DUF1320 family protein [Synechococcales cyanobacterium RU_4_20]